MPQNPSSVSSIADVAATAPDSLEEIDLRAAENYSGGRFDFEGRNARENVIGFAYKLGNRYPSFDGDFSDFPTQRQYESAIRYIRQEAGGPGLTGTAGDGLQPDLGTGSAGGEGSAVLLAVVATVIYLGVVRG